MFGNVDNSYVYVKDLRDELMVRNTDSRLVVKIDEEDKSLRRMFVCSKASIEGVQIRVQTIYGI